MKSEFKAKNVLMDEPALHLEKLQIAVQMYNYLLKFSTSVEVSLFASFKLIEIDVENAYYIAKESGIENTNYLDSADFKVSLANLKRCAACYDAEIDSLGRLFKHGSELDVQREHVKCALVQWKVMCGQMRFRDACKEYEDMFLYRQRVFGNAHCHVSSLCSAYQVFHLVGLFHFF